MTLVGVFNGTTFTFPLRKIDVHVDCVDDVAVVSAIQTYFNHSSRRINAHYKFPLYRGATVCDFSFEFAKGKITCEMKENSEAKKTYADAIAKGNQAALMSERNNEEYDITVGNIDPDETVLVNVKYIVQLSRDLDTDGLILTLPTTLTPRYDNRAVQKVDMFSSSASKNPPSLYNRDSNGNVFGANILDTNHEEERVPIEPEDTICYGTVADDAPVNIHISVKQTKGIDCCILPQWNGKVIKRNKTDYQYNCTLEGIALGEDFQMKVIPSEDATESNIIYAERYGDPNEVHECPRYTIKVCLNEKSTFKQSLDVRYEFIFVIDRSGSMSGNQIVNAKRALLTMMNSLPTDSFFNVFGFGDTWRRFYPKSVKYTKQTFEESKRMINAMEANMGGTDLNAVLTAIYDTPTIDGYKRNILLLTDGEVYDLESVFKITYKDSNVPIFTIGVGDSVSHELIAGLAERTNGNYEVIMNAGLIEAKVMRQLERSMYSPTTIEIFGDKYVLSPGQDSLILVTDNLDDGQSHIDVSINDSDVSEVYPLRWGSSLMDVEKSVDDDDDEDDNNRTSWKEHPLRLQWVRKSLNELQIRLEKTSCQLEQEHLREMIVELSIINNVLSPYTSMVGVLESDSGEVSRETITCPLHPGKYANANMLEEKHKLYQSAISCVDVGLKQVGSGSFQRDAREPYFSNTNVVKRGGQENLVESRGRENFQSASFSTITDVFSRAMQFDGSVSWETLSSLLNNLPMRPQMIHEDLWATLLFLAYMGLNSQRDDDVWKMNIAKSTRWIATENLSDTDFKEFYESAVIVCMNE